jgi:hypothetical protein
MNFALSGHVKDQNQRMGKMSTAELGFTPATELAAAIRQRELSPVEIVDTFLARIEALNPQLNAFLAVDADRARAAAKEAEAAVMRGEALGLLHGLPIPIKDLEPSAGIRCTFGSKFSEHHIAEIDGAVTGRVKAAGGIIIGKTNTSHYGYKDMCDKPLPPGWRRWRTVRTAPARFAFRRRCVASSVSKAPSAGCRIGRMPISGRRARIMARWRVR